SVASTKAFSSQVMLLWLLSVYIGKQLGTISKEEERIQAKNMLNSVNAMKVEPKLHEKIKRLSKRYLHGHGFFYIGRDVFYPLALEGALKLKEISYLHAEGYASAEMKHGPIALVDSNLFTIALLSKHLLFDKTKSNIEELSARDSTICVLSSEILEIADDFIQLEESESYMEEFFRMNLA
ncbi:SIS domain-containing protein, partial [Helicobacter pylori]